MSAKKIPPDIEPELLARAGRGESGDQIAAWLSSAHGIEMSGRRVRAFLETIRREREPIARAVVVEQLSKAVTADLTEMEVLAQRARTILDEAMNPQGEGTKKQPYLALQAISVEKSIRETRLRLSGGAPSDPGDGAQRAPTAVILLPPEKPIAAPQLPPPATKPDGTT